ncbi:MAG: DDE-type integrase/transposase/recombinase [Alphaproteobacteria bacterium]|nr:DDE-type integrase/transposase/recombinase [Alphaproteobacteria bacterium]
MVREVDKSTVDAAAWKEAVAREAVIRKLTSTDRPGRSDVLRACRELGLRRTRLYELLKAYRERPVTSSLLNRVRGTRPGVRRLPQDAEAVVAEALQGFYETRQKPSVSELQREVGRLCRVRGVTAPGWHALRARINAIDPAELTKARDGAKAARDRFRAVPGEYVAESAYEVVQIDHTLVDVIVVDRASRQPLQRPWLTLAIDVASRMVAGFYLTLEPPSTTSVALAIQNLVLPKHAYLARLGVEGEWSAAGLPDAIHVDNGKDFCSRALQRGAEEYGIALIHRPVATPHYGGHIERLIGTMMGAVHLLPGTTFSDIEARGDYDSLANSAMTLDELERWLALEILRYHAVRHGSLGIPPSAAWGEAVARRASPLRQPYDLEAFTRDFLPSVERIVRRSGVHLNGLRYWDDVLSVWAGRVDRPLRVAYDPRDLSKVFLRGPDDDWRPLRFANICRPPITLWELRRAQATLKERGLKLVDEQLVFDTIERQRALVEEASRRTKEVRRLLERRERALDGAASCALPGALEGEATSIGDDPPIDFSKIELFPVEEWS